MLNGDANWNMLVCCVLACRRVHSTDEHIKHVWKKRKKKTLDWIPRAKGIFERAAAHEQMIKVNALTFFRVLLCGRRYNWCSMRVNWMEFVLCEGRVSCVTFEMDKIPKIERQLCFVLLYFFAILLLFVVESENGRSTLFPSRIWKIKNKVEMKEKRKIISGVDESLWFWMQDISVVVFSICSQTTEKLVVVRISSLIWRLYAFVIIEVHHVN